MHTILIFSLPLNIHQVENFDIQHNFHLATFDIVSLGHTIQL